MHRRLPSLRGLQAFEAFARLGSMVAAAGELCVTHGAVSRQIRALEQQVGAVLVTGPRHQLALTPAGARLAASLGGAFDQIAAGLPGAQAEGEFVVSAPSTFAMKWLIPRLPRFVEAHPGVAIRIVEEDSGEPDFGGRGLHAAIRLHQGPAPAGLAVTAFLPQAFGVVVAPALLARVGGEGLLRAPRLHSRTYPDGWRLWAQAAQVELAPPSADRAFEHNSYMLEAAAAGLGAAVTAWAYVEAEIAQGRLVAPWGFVPLARRFALIRPAIARHPGAERFADWLRAEGRAAAPAPRRDIHESGS
jgi:DNA-binding transcriptional LysR family regulator